MDSLSTAPQPKKVFLETFGCQSNTLESLHLVHLLRQGDFVMAEGAEDADVVLFNTCSVRQNAEHKVFSRLGQLAEWKSDRPGRVLGVLGCMATSYKEELLDRAPHLDLVLGPDQYPKAADLLRKASDRSNAPTVMADFDPAYFPESMPDLLPSPHRAFVEILKGCDKFCTFCIVPFTRGREVSRDPESILEEVGRLVASGVREVTLLGQNVNSYGLGLRSRGGTPTFAALVRRVAAVPGLARLRFMTPHPLDLSDELVGVVGDTPHVCPCVHLPVQCGSDRLLKLMNRKYTVEHYLGRVRALQAARPDLALTSDLIVGFPGERDDDFEGTLRLMDEVRYDSVYSFKYSPRQGTPASRMLDQVPEEVKEGRLARLNGKANAHAAERAWARVGKVEDVMVEGTADRTLGALFGKTEHNRGVIFPGEWAGPPVGGPIAGDETPEAADPRLKLRAFKPGDLVKVRITGRRVANLFGDLSE